MARARLRIAVLGVALRACACLCVCGCIGPGHRQTLRFDVAPGPVGAEVTERHWYFFWGLVPTGRYDALRRCPNGVVAIREGPGERGALAWLPTLGIASRTTTYFCRAEIVGRAP